MKKNAFTLIELLAVIIILGLIALLIIPRIRNTIDDAKKNSNEVSVNALSRTATNYYLEQKTQKKDIENCTYDFTNKINTCTGLEFTGEKPDSGRLTIRKNGRVALAVQFNKKCYLKGYTTDKIEIIDYDETTCGANSDVFINYEMPELAVSGDGLYESLGEPGRYIYRGANPNNYIYLKEDGTNNTLYRIISYEPDGTIKVIRNASIGNMAFDSRTSESAGPRKNENNTFCNYTGTYYGCNVWGNQENTFYNDTTLTNLNQEFFYKYFPNNTAQSLQNHSNTGTVTQNSSLNDYLNTEWAPAQTLNNYISEHSFNVGGIYYTSSYTGGDKGLSKEKEEQNIYTWDGKIGLMNITDYVETSLNPTCTSVYSNFYYNTNYYKNSTQTLTGYDNWPCSNRSYNWMPKAITEWSLSAISSTRLNVWNVYSSGYCSNYSAYNTIGVRPAFYLKSSIKLRGLGTSDSPYELVES